MKIKSLILLVPLCLLLTSVFAQNLSPIEFIENKGQWDSRVRFMANVNGGALFVHKDGYTVLQHNEQDFQQLLEQIHHHTEESPVSRPQPAVLRSHAYRVAFENASAKATVMADKPLPTYNNYFIGASSNWATNCKIYQGITVQNIYPNIDVRYYSDKGAMKYDLIVKPGGRVDDIRLAYEGADGLEIKDKMLNIRTSIGTVREMPPYTYQYTAQGRQTVKAAYQLKGNRVSFDIRDYDRSQTLIIDPTMIFASFTNSTADNWGYTATYGADGSMYAGGIVFTGSGSFPVTMGAFQQNLVGGSGNDNYDIGIIKLSPDGSTRIYATYIGGNGAEQPHSLIADAAGNLIIAGRTNSPTYKSATGTPFPLRNPSADEIGPVGQYDIIVMKLDAQGAALLGSARIGGTGNDGVNGSAGHSAPGALKLNYGDDGRSEVILDGGGNIYLAASTQSTDFPTTANAFQRTSRGGAQDAVVLKFSPNVSRLFSSYLGGSEDDGAFVLSLHPATSDIYVAGGTKSANFQGVNASSMGSSFGGGVDGFVSIISNDGSVLKKSTFVGTTANDIIWGLKFDRLGFPYVMGQTLGNWPITTQWGQAGGRQFISKLKPDLSGAVYSTAFGTSNASAPNISPVAFLVDRCENVYVSGWGGNLGFPSAGTLGLPVTQDALVMNPPYTTPSQTDSKDFYFFVLKKDGASQLYGSFYGQNGGLPDHVDGGTSRFDENGVIYQAICANCSPNPRPYFPTTPGVWGPTNASTSSNGCNMAMIKIAMNLSGIQSGVQSAINGVARDTSGCVPLTVDFSDTVLNAVSYEWNFGDGTPQVTTREPKISHTYTRVGDFRVMLVAIDSATCNMRDTSFLNIKVGDLRARPDFTVTKLEPCETLNYRFDNSTVAPPGVPFTNRSFVWDFGDGSPRVTTGNGSLTHQYANPGSYRVKLFMVDSSYCNAPDSLEQVLNIATLVKADFTGPANACAPFRALFQNKSAGGQRFIWNFGDGTEVVTAGRDTISHFYSRPGTYVVRLKVIDEATCNREDSATFTVRAIGKPTAAIGGVSPQPPAANIPLTFTNNTSSDASRFKWFFGDGDSLVTASRDLVTHEYNATKTYTVTLIAYNSNGCSDTTQRQVQTLVELALDVPNAFTPLSGDINSVVMPRGFGISKLKFVIYNRLGQKVFETESRRVGWDGRYKGVLQPMDVYVYTLEVEFSDGTKATKKGDISLIR